LRDCRQATGHLRTKLGIPLTQQSRDGDVQLVPPEELTPDDEIIELLELALWGESPEIGSGGKDRGRQVFYREEPDSDTES
jgi:hypothetical protein